MPNTNSFTFIYDLGNENSGQIPFDFITRLTIPTGFFVDKKIFQGNFNIAQGFNFAMRNSLSKYKIYLNKKVEIVNLNFLNDILALFKKHSELGLLGVVGAKTLPQNGNWRESNQRCGKLILGGKVLAYQEVVHDDYESVQAVDGILMITQYDLPWRADLFHDHYFYDSAQCLEFIKAGYKVGIPRQPEPWCYNHDNSDALTEFYRERETFYREYCPFLDPK